MTKQAQKKSKYNLWQNTGFMVRLALKIHPGVIFICITLALSIAGGQVAELLFTPSLLQKLETGAPLPEVLLTIGLFCGSLLILNGLTAYLNKNTLIKLLCRLYDPCEGQILLNGINIRKYQYNDYINLFSVVFQAFQLFALPLGENVAGAADYDHEYAEKCLKQAGFTDRLPSMTDDLDTYLYKEMKGNGVNVSGGEAQKIAIARALYKDAWFIILDEPTAALDPITEMEIYSKFNDIAGDKTAVYISHRLSSCKFCDEIAVLHEGAIVQKGTHEELVSNENGKYFLQQLLTNFQLYYIGVPTSIRLPSKS